MTASSTVDRFIKGIVILAVLIILTLIIYKYAILLAYALVALILSYILDPSVNRLQAAGLNRIVSIIIVLVGVGLIVYYASTAVFPKVGTQIINLTHQINIQSVQNLAGILDTRLHESIPFIPADFLKENLVRLARQAFNISGLTNTIGNVFGIFANVFTAIIVVPFATFFFLKDGSKFRRDILQYIPNSYFETTLNIIDKIETRLGMYFKGVALDCFLVGLMAYILLSFAGLQNALSVGIAVGIANSIPYFGPVMGYLLTGLVAIFETGDFSLIWTCMLALLVTHIVDNVLFQPFIFSRSSGMHPIVVLFVLMVGAETAGLIGMLLAIPAATIIKITIREIIWSLNNYYVFRPAK